MILSAASSSPSRAAASGQPPEKECTGHDRENAPEIIHKYHMQELTAERLRQVLHYDPDTGLFRWRVTRASNATAGRPAGCSSERSRYVVIGVDGRTYTAHRLAWLYMTGEWPPEGLDHVNLDKKDNRFSNLRLASKAENERNKPRRKDNSSGYKGAIWVSGRKRFRAEITVDGKKRHLGYFERAKDAHDAYRHAAAKFYGDFARPS